MILHTPGIHLFYFLCQVFHITSIGISVWNDLYTMYKYILQVIWIRFNVIYMLFVAVKPYLHLWYHVLYFHITSTTSYMNTINYLQFHYCIHIDNTKLNTVDLKILHVSVHHSCTTCYCKVCVHERSLEDLRLMCIVKYSEMKLFEKIKTCIPESHNIWHVH